MQNVSTTTENLWKLFAYAHIHEFILELYRRSDFCCINTASKIDIITLEVKGSDDNIVTIYDEFNNNFWTIGR